MPFLIHFLSISCLGLGSLPLQLDTRPHLRLMYSTFHLQFWAGWQNSSEESSFAVYLFVNFVDMILVLWNLIVQVLRPGSGPLVFCLIFLGWLYNHVCLQLRLWYGPNAWNWFGGNSIFHSPYRFWGSLRSFGKNYCGFRYFDLTYKGCHLQKRCNLYPWNLIFAIQFITTLRTTEILSQYLSNKTSKWSIHFVQSFFFQNTCLEYNVFTGQLCTSNEQIFWQ